MNNSICRILDAERDLLAEVIKARQQKIHPEQDRSQDRSYEEASRRECFHSVSNHLLHLTDAVAAFSPHLFSEYIDWAKIMLSARGVSATDFSDSLTIMHEVVRERLSPEQRSVIDEYFEGTLKRVSAAVSDVAPTLEGTGPYSSLAQEFLKLLLNGERHIASRLVLDAIESGVTVKDVYLNVFQASQRELGRLWQLNQITIAQEHYCTAATQLIMAQLYPRIFRGEKNGRKMIATSVAGELHEIGVRIIADFFEMEGWDTYYLGANSPAQTIVQTITELRPNLLAISATMTFHIRAVQHLITMVRSSPECDAVKILVGGYPFNIEPTLWQRLGADAYAADASEAIVIASGL